MPVPRDYGARRERDQGSNPTSRKPTANQAATAGAPNMNAKSLLTVALPYLAAAAICAAVYMGKVSPEMAAMLAVALGLPSPLAHAAGKLGEALKPGAPPEA